MQANLDRRKTQRKRKRLPIHYGSKKRGYIGTTMDISTNGLSINTHKIFSPGTPLMLQLKVDGNYLSAQGEVRWAKKVPLNLLRLTHGGMGLRFTQKSEEISKYIHSLLPKAIPAVV